MSKSQYAILRFQKYKGPTVSRIEAYNERTKEVYVSNPDIRTERSKDNFHMVIPQGKYREVSDRMIQEAGWTVVESLITASPEFFAGKKPGEIKTFFDYAMEFMSINQNPDTFLSAVVHMDEKTPHMHLCFVPLPEDYRLSAKEAIGNKKKLIQIWLTKQESQDESLQSRLKSMYPKWKKEKYLVAVYHSGTEDLYRSTLDLLTYNKKRYAELAAKRKNTQVQTQMQL